MSSPQMTKMFGLSAMRILSRWGTDTANLAIVANDVFNRLSMPFDDVIAGFYDAHPYPPRVEDLSRSVDNWDEMTRRVEHFRHWPTIPYREEKSILIAGCGTSQAARWAARYPKASVLGIDVSPSSLDAERRLALHHELGNLELMELPIEQVGSLGREFDLVVCTGVLHHLVEPVVGLRALRGVLSERGALQLLVYATYGRFGVSLMRAYASRIGIGLDEVDALLETLREVPLGHPISHVLREARDFSDRDALADALLNPREASYTVPELFGLLDDGGVRFARWAHQAPYRPQVGIMRVLPDGVRIAAMNEVDQYATMELFRGTINRHSLIAYRDDSPLPDPPIEWGTKNCNSYRPMVPSAVVVVEENLPPGMAAAIINRAHVDRDLVCFLTADELAVLSEIDGHTSLGSIPSATATLFERLWLQDLVMIDASGV